MLSVLLAKLKSEIDDPLNASFVKGLTAMMEKCQEKLTKLLENDFIVMASLLDPRYTAKVESIIGKTFKDYIGMFIEKINSYRVIEEVQNETGEEIDVARADSNLPQYDFWGMLDQPGSESQQNSPQRDFDNQLEVSIFKF